MFFNEISEVGWLLLSSHPTSLFLKARCTIQDFEAVFKKYGVLVRQS